VGVTGAQPEVLVALSSVGTPVVNTA